MTRCSNRSAFSFAIILLVAVAGCAESPEGPLDTIEHRDSKSQVVEIPLDQIWAYQMPDTRPMTDKTADEPLAYISPEGPLVWEIRKALPFLRADRPVVAEPGFAVV